DLVTVAGDDLMYWWSSDQLRERPMAFTGEMTEELGDLSAAVIGVSGTGSIVAEQLSRLGLGQVTLIDFDQVEPKNLNRILNTTSSDAAEHRLKVEAFAEAIGRFRGPGVAVPIAASIASPEALIAAGQCDLIFSCVDTLEARYYADLLATAFHLPLFDVGVSIKLRENGSANAIGDVSGRVDYVQPGGSTLQDRGVYSAQGLSAEYMRNVDPETYQHDVEAGYIQGLAEEAPAVISLNMRAAAACVNEFLARAYPFRLKNSRYAQTKFSLATCEEEYKAERDFPRAELYSREQAEQLLNLDRRDSES
ncbi:MAG: ThiF family adenylyltransferase, partial [Polynucleobacter sp.]|nr:ThiF family adenylyltransferase [Polynucleobacter sp.]